MLQRLNLVPLNHQMLDCLLVLPYHIIYRQKVTPWTHRYACRNSSLYECQLHKTRFVGYFWTQNLPTIYIVWWIHSLYTFNNSLKKKIKYLYIFAKIGPHPTHCFSFCKQKLWLNIKHHFYQSLTPNQIFFLCS